MSCKTAYSDLGRPGCFGFFGPAGIRVPGCLDDRQVVGVPLLHSARRNLSARQPVIIRCIRTSLSPASPLRDSRNAPAAQTKSSVHTAAASKTPETALRLTHRHAAFSTKPCPGSPTTPRPAFSKIQNPKKGRSPAADPDCGTTPVWFCSLVFRPWATENQVIL